MIMGGKNSLCFYNIMYILFLISLKTRFFMTTALRTSIRRVSSFLPFIMTLTCLGIICSMFGVFSDRMGRELFVAFTQAALANNLSLLLIPVLGLCFDIYAFQMRRSWGWWFTEYAICTSTSLLIFTLILCMIILDYMTKMH